MSNQYSSNAQPDYRPPQHREVLRLKSKCGGRRVPRFFLLLAFLSIGALCTPWRGLTSEDRAKTESPTLTRSAWANGPGADSDYSNSVRVVQDECSGAILGSLMVTRREQTALTVVWRADADREPNEFQLRYEKWPSDGNVTSFRVPGVEREATLRNLEPGTFYLIRIAGVCSGENLSEDFPITNRTLPERCERVVGLQAGPVTPNSVHIEWDELPLAEAYKVELFSASGTARREKDTRRR